ncbi:MAG: hypothetical protein ACREF4_00760 [Gammaproteobacteria bacterium]
MLVGWDFWRVTDSAAEAVTAVRDVAIPGFSLRYRAPKRRWLLIE